MSGQHDEVGIFGLRNFLDNARRPSFLDTDSIGTHSGAERSDKRANLGTGVPRGLLRVPLNGVSINVCVAHRSLREHVESMNDHKKRIRKYT